METVFLTIVNMSITASWIAVAVMILRLLLKKAPKAICVILWALVGVRLICPFSIESVFSLIPSVETVPQDILYSQTPTIHSGIPIVNETINPILSNNLSPTIDASVKPMQTVASAASVAWLVGIAAMLLYTVISYVRIRRSVNEAVPHQDNVWLCDRIDTPFILGVIRPRIYLPSAMNEQDIPYVIAHENAHLKRRDHFWKPLGFLLLAVYWFNPILWVAYTLLCKDIELACDEKVIKELGVEVKKPYSEALIHCSIPRKMIAACPLAFGEVGVKKRIKSVLHYKKPAFWVIIAAVVASVAVALCFLTNPKQEEPPSDDTTATTTTTLLSSGDTTSTTAPSPDYSGVPLNMPEYISQVFESYDHTAFTKVVPYSANVVKILSSEGSPAYVELSEERIKELNALYESITEFKDYTGSIGADPTISIRRNGETHYLGWGCATERALNLYIDKILHCDASDEEWRTIDETEYYSESHENPPSSKHTGVALKMPDRISIVEEGYGDYKVEPFSPNTIAFYANGSDEPFCFTLREERIKELNALYESITEFKDYGGEIGSNETIVVELDGQTYRFRSGCATQRALNLYIDKIFARESLDEQWREIDNTVYYNELQENPPTSDEYTGVALNMPDSVAWQGGYEGVQKIFTKYNDNTIKIVTNSEFSFSKLVTLSEERIKELNALYESVTDFSQSSFFGWSELNVIIHREGQVHILGDGCAKQGELNRYLRLLSSCNSTEGTWEHYPKESAARELQEYFSQYNKWVTMNTTTPTTTTTAYTGTPLHMPDSINWCADRFGSLGLFIYRWSDNAILFYSDYYGEKIIELTPDEITTHNALYESVTDFASSPEPQDDEENVSLSDGDAYYWFCPSRTTQPQAAQYMQLLESYYFEE